MIFLILIIIIHLLIISKLIFFPYPELFLFPYLKNTGLIPYSQIVDQHFPGLLLLPINFATLGMNSPETARYWLMGSLVINHSFIYLITRKFFLKNNWAVTSNIFYLLWQPFLGGWELWVDSFEASLLLPLCYLVLDLTISSRDERQRFLKTLLSHLGMGILMGIIITFKQSYSIWLILVVAWIIFKDVKVTKPNTITSLNLKIIFLFTGFFLVLGPVIFYLLKINVFKQFTYWTITFNFLTYSKYTLRPNPSQMLRFIFIFAPILIIFYLKKNRLILILFLFALGGLIGVLNRFDFVYLQPALPFVAIFFTLALIFLLQKKLPLIIGLYLIITLYLLSIFFRGHLGDKIYFFDKSNLNLSQKIKSYTHPGERIFIFGLSPHLYYMSNTLPAGDLLVFQLPWYMEVYQEQVLKSLVQDPPEIIIEDRTVEVEGYKITEYAKILDSYIQGHYQPFDKVDNVLFLKKYK